MKKVFLLFLFIFPSIALSATNIPTSQLIYTWGYGDVINEILQAIKGIILETDYIFKAAMAIALLIFSIKKLGDDRVSPVLEIGKMFGLFAVVWYFFLTAPNDDKHRFMIHDEVTSKDYIVSQIPTGIGVTFALMSNFEKIMLDGMEKYFSTPQSANFSSAGLGFSLEAMMSLPKIKLSNINPTAQKNLDLFFRNCVAHGIRLHQNGRELYGKSDNFIDDLFDSIGTGSQLTVYYKTDKATGAETSDMLPCTEAGAKIKQDIMNSMDMAQTLHTALLGFEKDKALYEQKFQGAVQIFNAQATSARAYLQQSMLLFASQDAIINTAKSVGLDPAAVAANTAIADQNFFASMQTQGRLAQTYLPLAKAYLTAIIIGISWLIAILSVIFASYSYIRMFFVLCLWMTLWTPILCIINYLNDLNLMKVASVITEGRVALSVSDNMLIFRKVAESSNFINYMVMMTPLLAFAIAKGSEMGFVNLATGIAGSLTKAAGSGGSFSNQQGQSTESKMSAPKGDEVIAYGAGQYSQQTAQNIEGTVVSKTKMGVGFGNNDGNTFKTQSGSTMVEDSNHNILNSNIVGLSNSTISKNTMARKEEMSQALQDISQTQQGKEFLSNFLKSKGLTVNRGDTYSYDSSEGLNQQTSSGTGSTTQDKIDTIFAGGTQVGGQGGRISAVIQDSHSEIDTKNTSKQNSADSGYRSSDIKIGQILENDSMRADLSQALKTSQTQSFQDAASKIDAYSESKTYETSLGSNNHNAILSNYAKSHSISNEEALVAVEKLSAQGNFQEIAKYSNATNNSNLNSNGIRGIDEGANYFNPSNVKENYHGNKQTVSDNNKVKEGDYGQIEGNLRGIYLEGKLKDFDSKNNQQFIKDQNKLKSEVDGTPNIINPD